MVISSEDGTLQFLMVAKSTKSNKYIKSIFFLLPRKIREYSILEDGGGGCARGERLLHLNFYLPPLSFRSILSPIHIILLSPPTLPLPSSSPSFFPIFPIFPFIGINLVGTHFLLHRSPSLEQPSFFRNMIHILYLLRTFLIPKI